MANMRADSWVLMARHFRQRLQADVCTIPVRYPRGQQWLVCAPVPVCIAGCCSKAGCALLRRAARNTRLLPSAYATRAESEFMLEVQDMHLSFARYSSLLRREWLPVLNGVSCNVQRGEMVALIGASGAGKSLLAHAVLGILPRTAKLHAHMVFDGQPLTPERQAALRGKRMALVPQAVTYLDPTAVAQRQVAWAALAAQRVQGKAAAQQEASAELLRYGLPQAAHRRYPHQLSGGMARRVLTAIATVSHADLLIADEPTSGLDPEVCQMALQHLRSLADAGRAVLVITHDLDAVRHFADRIVVMQAGRTVETVDAATFASGQAQHPFTRALYRALPQNGFHDYAEAAAEAAHV